MNGWANVRYGKGAVWLVIDRYFGGHDLCEEKQKPVIVHENCGTISRENLHHDSIINIEAKSWNWSVSPEAFTKVQYKVSQ